MKIKKYKLNIRVRIRTIKKRVCNLRKNVRHSNIYIDKCKQIKSSAHGKNSLLKICKEQKVDAFLFLEISLTMKVIDTLITK